MEQRISYGEFADVYDLLTDDVEYEKRTSYVEELIKIHLAKEPDIVCDLGCGTGTVCSILNAGGYDCIGIDSSESMLNVASKKNSDGKILFLNQDICSFELYGTVDVFLSLLDTVNYITDSDSLEKLFALVNNYLNPGGIFIFDINTRYKFENILGNNDLVYEKENIFYTWENYYEDELLDFRLNFFVPDGKDRFRRITEEHTQRYYSVDFLAECAQKCNLQLVSQYGDMKFTPADSCDERIYIVMKKQQA